MKNHHHQGHVAPTANSPELIHASIATRAYALWEERGNSESQAEALWLQAEQELVAERAAGKQPSAGR